jgi:hypothetical protein
MQLTSQHLDPLEIPIYEKKDLKQLNLYSCKSGQPIMYTEEWLVESTKNKT